MLAEHFMAMLAAEDGKRPKRLAPEAAARLQQYGGRATCASCGT